MKIKISVALLGLAGLFLMSSASAQTLERKAVGTTPVKEVPGMRKNPVAQEFPLAKGVQSIGATKDPVTGFIKTITQRDLEAHLSFIASDELEGRETGKRGQKIAAKYLASQFAKFGLAPPVKTAEGPSYYQTYELLSTQIKEISLTFNGKDKYEKIEDFFYFRAEPLVQNLDETLVFAGYGILEPGKYNNYAGLDVKGKAVVILDGEPMEGKKSLVTGEEKPSSWAEGIRKKYEIAKKQGASAVITIMEGERYDKYGKSEWVAHRMEKSSMQMIDDMGGSIPALYVSAKVGERLLKEGKMNLKKAKAALTDSEKVPQVTFKSLKLGVRSVAILDTVTAENVLGLLEGTDKKDEIVILTAHYDHIGVEGDKIFNGADDDGSGTVAVLEMAEAFAIAAEKGFRPCRSILFMPVSGEEKGLMGSRYYTNHPVFPLENTVANLNIDMIGRSDKVHLDSNITDYVYIIGSDMLSTDLHKANEEANIKYVQTQLDYTYNTKDDPNRYYYRSDHYNFAKNGIPVVFYFTGVHEDYHRHTDEIHKIDFVKMEKLTRLVFSTAWIVANSPERLVVDKK